MSASVLPDCEAQKLWDRVAAKSDRISDTVDGIARLTVSGRRTRGELRQAGDLLGRAVALLERTSGREGRAYAERVRSMDEDSAGGSTERCGCTGALDSLNGASLEVTRATALVDVLSELAASGSSMQQLDKHSLGETLGVLADVLKRAQGLVQTAFPFLKAAQS